MGVAECEHRRRRPYDRERIEGRKELIFQGGVGGTYGQRSYRRFRNHCFGAVIVNASLRAHHGVRDRASQLFLTHSAGR